MKKILTLVMSLSSLSINPLADFIKNKFSGLSLRLPYYLSPALTLKFVVENSNVYKRNKVIGVAFNHKMSKHGSLVNLI